MTTRSARLRALRAELQKHKDRIDAAYWAFTRQARAQPPVLVVPESYRRVAEITRELRELKGVK